MKIKINTNYIEFEYTDDFSDIKEDVKRRIIEIIHEIMKNQIVSSFNALGVPNSERKHNPTDEELSAAKKMPYVWNGSTMPIDKMSTAFTQKK